MPSTVSWLDTSAEQRRRANEILALFTDLEGRDELGLGTVRDALSDILFPGTSVLLTRARYALFVPWCFQVPSVKARHHQAHIDAAERTERRLVETLISEEPATGAGVIGRRVGREVQNLPRVLYWVALTEWGIVRRPSISALGGYPTARDEVTELDDRTDADWHPDLPPAPVGFPATTEGGFQMNADEAGWLRDRILSTCTDTALSAVLTPAPRTADPIGEIRNAAGPWDVPRLAARHDVQQAAWFSLVMHGASLLYNLMVAERARDAELTRFEDHTDIYRAELAEWATELNDLGGPGAWDLSDFWELVLAQRPQPLTTKTFIDGWVASIAQDDPARVPEHAGLRSMISSREKRKGQQSRLLNDRLLHTWSGSSGAGRMAFRWGNVRRIAADVLEGIQHDA